MYKDIITLWKLLILPSYNVPCLFFVIVIHKNERINTAIVNSQLLSVAAQSKRPPVHNSLIGSMASVKVKPCVTCVNRVQ